MDNKKWTEQFKSSIRARDESDYRLEHVLPYKDEGIDSLCELLAAKAVELPN